MQSLENIMNKIIQKTKDIKVVKTSGRYRDKSIIVSAIETVIRKADKVENKRKEEDENQHMSKAA